MDAQSWRGPEPDDNEIDLVDLWLIFKRYQLQFWVTFAVLAVLGSIIVFALPNKYTYTATLEIGGLQTQAGFDELTTPLALKTALENAYIPQATRQYLATSAEQNAPAVTVNAPEEGKLVIMQAEGKLAQDAQVSALLGAIVSRVQSVHTEELSDQLQTEISALQAQVSALKQYGQRLTAIQQTLAASEIVAASLLDSQLADISQQIAQLEGQIQRLSTSGLQPTHLLGEITRSLQPSSLGAGAMLILVALLAAFAALLVVFASAFLAHAKERQASVKTQPKPASVVVKNPSERPFRRASGSDQ
ncbi:MAG TPA: hypothetical protein VFP95_04655 [Gammaproteobacteria bacterium]|nr:hypothetical protein [Gammaproteobacteria bacterium]